MSTAFTTRPLDLRRWQRLSLVVGVVALVVCVVGALFSPAPFFRAYLSAYVFYLGLGLGCMALLMVYHLTGGGWGFLTRRILEAGMRTLPLLTVFFIPVACGLNHLYLWAQPSVVADDALLQHQQVYLNIPFFWGRAALFFLLWLALAYFLSSWSDSQDRTDDPRLGPKFRRLSALGLVVYGVCLHFAAVDWVMSLQPVFHSTIFGPLFASGQFVSALAFVIIWLAWLLPHPPLEEVASAEVLNDLGNLLLTFLIIWAYMAWFQFMLVWIANLPTDIIWYLPRLRGGWLWVTNAIVIFHVVVPFFLLLMRAVKQTPRAVACVAGLILFMQLVFDYHQVQPAFDAPHMTEHWLDFLTPLAIGGPWLAYFLWQLGRRPLLPRHDVSQEYAVHLRSVHEAEQALVEALSHG